MTCCSISNFLFYIYIYIYIYIYLYIYIYINLMTNGPVKVNLVLSDISMMSKFDNAKNKSRSPKLGSKFEEKHYDGLEAPMPHFKLQAQ